MYYQINNIVAEFSLTVREGEICLTVYETSGDDWSVLGERTDKDLTPLQQFSLLNKQIKAKKIL